jgi:hypothetical protein
LKPAPAQNEQQAAQSAQALAQLSAQHQQQLAVIHQLSTIIEQKQVEAASREKIAEMQEATKLAIAEITAKSQTLARQQADRLAVLEAADSIADRAHEHALASVSAAQNAAGQQADQQHQQQMQQQDQAHQANQQQSAQDAAAQQAAQQQPLPKAA